MKNILSALVLAFSTSIVACSGSDATDNSASSDDAIKTASLVGTFVDGTNDLPFYSYILNADHTFFAFGGCRQTGSGPHCNAITEASGSWKLTTSKGSPAIKFVDAFNQKTEYFYQLSGKDLTLTSLDYQESGVFVKQTDDAKFDGTFSENAKGDLPYYSYTFDSAKHSYQTIGGCRPNGSGPHCFAITESTGTWALTTSKGSPAIKLTDSFNQTSEYDYMFSGSDLTLTAVKGNQSGTLTK